MKRLLLLLSLIIISISCVRDVNLEQIDSSIFEISSNMALLKLDLTQDDFLEEPRFNKLFLIELEEFFYESTSDSLALVNQFTNTFDRDFICYMEFIDKSNNEILDISPTQKFVVPALSTVIIQDPIIFEGEKFELFNDARRINVIVSDNGLTPIENGEFKMQSVIHYTFVIEPNS